jgi:protease I
LPPSVMPAGMLASADIIRGRTVTSYFSIKDDLVNAGGNWVDKEAVVDGHLVTSGHQTICPAFMRAVIGVLAGGVQP